MDVFRSLLSLLFSFALLISPIQAQDTGWVIDEFESNITAHEDASVSVEETIRVDFDGLSKHGIYRTIPVVYRDRFGNKVNIRLKIDQVTGENGQGRQYQASRKGENLEIKIGDPNETISGFQTYILKYRVQRVISRLSDHDELYWNVTGNAWPVSIRSAKAKVLLPQPATDATCFSGPYGSSLNRCTVGSLGSAVDFQADIELNPAEGFTIVTSLPKGAIKEPSVTTRLWWLVSDNWPYAIPLITLSFLLWLYWQHGRDQQYKSLFDPSRGIETLPAFSSELVPQTYAPITDIRPAEAGTLIDEEVNLRDLTATIVDLAVRGYLRIEEVAKDGLFRKADYRLIWVKKDIGNLDDYESKLVLALFGKGKTGDTVLLSELKYHFAAHLSKIRDSLYESLTKKGIFSRRPDKVVTFYRVIGIALGLLGFPAFSQSVAWGVALASSGLLIVLFAKAMPKRTAHGRKEYLRVLGLRNFISLGAYREQLWEKANLFEEVLPYAIAFSLTHKLAAAFAKINVPPPSWYTGSRPFQVNAFAYSMEDFTNAATTTMPATKSASSGGSGFGGGGFSGGGFGGGGGGSW